MSDGEVARLSKAIEALSNKTDKQHSESQKAQQRDREAFQSALATQQKAFSTAMNEQRELFQEAINKQFLEHVNLSSDVGRTNTLLTLCVGDGKPGEGRLGVLEETVETLKKFRWQALAITSAILLLADKISHR